MSTSTARLGLLKPDATDFVNVVTQLSGNLQIIDTNIYTFPCLSSARPGAPFQGMLIYETDTGLIYVWSGAAWTIVTRKYQQATDVATAETTTGGSYADLATAGPALSNIPLIAGVTYKITVSAFMKNSNTAAVSKMGFAISGADTVAAADADAVITSNVDNSTCSRVCGYTPATTGNHTITAKYSSSGGATATFSQRRLSIE